VPPLIDTFLANIRDKGFVKSNRFVSFIRTNPYVTQALGYSNSFDISTRLAVTCYSANVQSPTFLTHEFGVTSPNRLIPYAINSNNASGISMEFYCLGDYFEKEFFTNWMRTIVYPVTRQVAYYDDFAKGTEIDVVLLPNFVADFEGVMDYIENSDKKINEGSLPGFTFTEVYPFMYTFNGGSVNYQANTTPASVKIDFMFREMHPFMWKPPTPGTIAKPNNYSRFTDEEALQRVSNFNGKAETVKAKYEDSKKEFQQYLKKLNKIQYEKQKIAKEYDQKRNIPRGVDGKLLNPQVDGLPAENPNDRIRQSLFGALSFVQQGRGFGIF
jgi:hypothetical protein